MKALWRRLRRLTTSRPTTLPRRSPTFETRFLIGRRVTIQAVRNLLYVAGIPDAIQLPVERYLPVVVFDYLKHRFPKDDLIKILTWIALHPEDGMVIDEISELGIDGAAGDPMVVRERAYLYAIKYIARLTDRQTAY